MKTCGIVVEYNPFHNGHAYQLQKIKEVLNADAILVVMSGHYVQRGEPAILDKWTRTQLALEQGVDVVIELPYIYATQSATFFAKAAVDLLKLAQVDYICFGSECGNLENLQEIAETSINPNHIREAMQDGTSYPKAYSLLTGSMLSNDILAVSYLKALQGSTIQPFLIQRTGEHYHSLNKGIYASAKSIRHRLENQESIEDSLPYSFPQATLHFMKEWYPMLRYELLSHSRSQLQSIFLVEEGIEKLLQQAALVHENYEEFLKATVNYRYTKARIQRTCLQIFNHITKQEVKDLKPLRQLRILGFNETGRSWMKYHKELPILVKFSKLDPSYRQMELKVTTTYSLIHQEKELIKRELMGPIYLKK